MKTTRYFDTVRLRADRTHISQEWIELTIAYPVRQQTQADGRIRLWAPIGDAGGRFLRVVLLPDGETVHNAFFDRRFTP
jgi:hypothetical protein